jgi:pyridinium-3,5-biscarboxylic acid mononucleotide sulfurtransferase
MCIADAAFVRNGDQSLIDAAETKFQKLLDLLRPKLDDGLVIALSGGVDSTFLVWAAEQQRRKTGGELIALTTTSESYSQAERADVERFIAAYDIPHTWAASRELLDARYTANNTDRCFHCKTELFRVCRDAAHSLGFKWIAYGYNASDQAGIRPGHQAAVENAILSPLAEARLTKEEIRELMRRRGLELADKPASPCLSSRLMTGVEITPRKLNDVEHLESILREGGLSVFRVRLHEQGDLRFLRIETEAEEMPLALAVREQLVSEARSRGYEFVTLDLAGYRSGGGNVTRQ